MGGCGWRSINQFHKFHWLTAAWRLRKFHSFNQLNFIPFPFHEDSWLIPFQSLSIIDISLSSIDWCPMKLSVAKLSNCTIVLDRYIYLLDQNKKGVNLLINGMILRNGVNWKMSSPGPPPAADNANWFHKFHQLSFVLLSALDGIN